MTVSLLLENTQDLKKWHQGVRLSDSIVITTEYQIPFPIEPDKKRKGQLPVQKT